MAVNVGDVIRVTAEMDINGVDDVINVVHIENHIQAYPSDDLYMDDVATWLDTTYGTMNSRTPDNLNYVAIKGQNITQSILMPSKAWPSLVVGGDVGGAMAQVNTPMIFFRTTQPRRIGKIYLPYIGETFQEGGVLDGGTLTALDSFGTLLRTPFLGPNANFRYVVWSRKFLGLSVPFDHVVPTVLRTQRRRRQGVGS